MRLKITVLSFKNTISANKVNHCNNDGPKNAANNAEADVKEILERARAKGTRLERAAQKGHATRVKEIHNIDLGLCTKKNPHLLKHYLIAVWLDKT